MSVSLLELEPAAAAVAVVLKLKNCISSVSYNTYYNFKIVLLFSAGVRILGFPGTVSGRKLIHYIYIFLLY